jgi:phenylalanyl-tRNA synthetase beta chain
VLDRLLLPAGDPLRDVVVLDNPMSEAQSILRPTLLPSLLDAAALNRARGAGDLALFEAGTVYRKGEGDLADEHTGLAVLMTGAAVPASWRDDGPPRADFFAAKGVLEAVMAAVRADDWRVEPAQRPFLHPGRAATVVMGADPVGFLGELHPRVAAGWDFDEPVAVFAIDLDRVLPPLAEEVEKYRDLTSFPSLRQDIAVVVADDVPAQRVVDVVRAAGAPVLAGAQVFDVYRGAQLGEGRVSLALHLEFRGDRTLSDEDVAPVRERIVAELRDQLGAQLRG